MACTTYTLVRTQAKTNTQATQIQIQQLLNVPNHCQLIGNASQLQQPTHLLEHKQKQVHRQNKYKYNNLIYYLNHCQLIGHTSQLNGLQQYTCWNTSKNKYTSKTNTNTNYIFEKNIYRILDISAIYKKGEL